MDISRAQDTPRTVALQSVLYNNHPADILRSVTAMAVSARLAAEAGVIARWEIALGDCSGVPVLHEEAARQVEHEVRARDGNFTYIHFGENLGHGGGHNRLASTADAELLGFVNPDGLLDPQGVTAIVSAIVGEVGIADGRQMPLEHPKSYDQSRGDTSWASGAIMFSRSDVFNQLGGFDSQTFFLYSDDVDLSWRVRLAGYRVVHVPDARLFHDKRLTTTADYEPTQAELYYSAEATLLLATKYSRRDVVDAAIALYTSEKKDHVLKAVAEYERRAASGQLPEAIDEEHAVGYFEHGFHASHRY